MEYLFGERRIPGDPASNTEDRARVAAPQDVDGFGTSGTDLLDECGVVEFVEPAVPADVSDHQGAFRVRVHVSHKGFGAERADG